MSGLQLGGGGVHGKKNAECLDCGKLGPNLGETQADEHTAHLYNIYHNLHAGPSLRMR